MSLARIGIHRRSIMLTWLVSYITILLLPVLLSIVVYIESSRTLESEIHQANSSLLKQVREVMDSHFQAMERLNIEMTWNFKVQDLLYSNKYHVYPNDYNYDVYQISQDLKLYKSAYSLIDYFYIYLPGTDKAILPGLYRDGSFTYDILHSDPGFPYAKWRSIVNQSGFKGFLPMIRIGDDGKKLKTVAYVSSYPSDKGAPTATNVLMIDQSRILGSIENMELFNEGDVLILNKQNEVLVSNSDKPMPADFPFEQLNEDSNLFYYNKNGENYEVLHIQSARSGLKYISMIPSRLYWVKAEHVRNLTYTSILVSLLGGGLLTTFFLRRNYNPVRRLVQAVSGKAALDLHQSANEFHYIEQALDHTLAEMDNISSQMKQQHHILRSNFIVRLLKGRLDSQVSLSEAMAAFNMKFGSDQFAVILMNIEEIGPFYERIQGMDPGGKRKLLQFILTNVMEEIVSRRNRGYVVEIDEAFACLINFQEEEEAEQRSTLLQIARETQEFLKRHYLIHLTLSISSVHCKTIGISQCYTEAMDAMEYKLVMGSKEILSYEEIRREAGRDTGAGYYYPLQAEQQLINCVKIGDFEKAKRTLGDIIDGNLKRPAGSVALARCLMMDLVGTMMKIISDIGDVQESFLLRNPKRIERLASCVTIQEMQQQMTELLEQVCQYTAEKRQMCLQQSRQRALTDLVERVAHFIDEHYSDLNLNISMIGQHFDMKPTYLSKLFKDQTGEGLLDAINKTRIEQAKLLMEETDRTIGDVAASVGFNDVNAFIRAFKKYEAVTPGKFKEALKV
ncbi:helix-turn-helix domain-containing protein [Paenibacillus filicis]|uniref:Helix-turn-helix domain-containing protein n=1 Tax=Paenibacillus gyeongsangnamensis TaxID=3388067 RepID=A0ABT4QCN9_9BACL|nr:helix-turn-helix domain-containing protein [Paenibacillus filicis]MCZ8514573.1 helix-turn-helix domain-containing protein [Paenibacillus filicis]